MSFEFPTFSLCGRKALVTGASRGIGQALALALAHAGADVAVNARREENLQETLKAFADMGHTGHAVAFDVREIDQIGPGVERAAAALGGLDILINNAGVEQVAASLEVAEAQWDRIVGTNLKGAFFCAQAAGRLMVAADNGAMVNVCSLTSAVGVPAAVPYGASKSGLVGVTRALAVEWARSGIRVNGIGPGYFRTELTESFFRDAGWISAMQAKIPAGRFGAMEDLMGATVFLCSDAARYISGQVLYIDGGYLASI